MSLSRLKYFATTRGIPSHYNMQPPVTGTKTTTTMETTMEKKEDEVKEEEEQEQEQGEEQEEQKMLWCPY